MIGGPTVAFDLGAELGALGTRVLVAGPLALAPWGLVCSFLRPRVELAASGTLTRGRRQGCAAFLWSREACGCVFRAAARTHFTWGTACVRDCAPSRGSPSVGAPCPGTGRPPLERGVRAHLAEGDGSAIAHAKQEERHEG